jgi:hypothetical protein
VLLLCFAPLPLMLTALRRLFVAKWNGPLWHRLLTLRRRRTRVRCVVHMQYSVVVEHHDRTHHRGNAWAGRVIVGAMGKPLLLTCVFIFNGGIFVAFL